MNLLADAVAPRWFPYAAAAAGVAAGSLTVGHRPGVGLTVALAAVGGALLPAVRRSLRPADWCLAATGAALAVMPAVRDAEWLVALDLLAVAAIGCLVLVGLRGWWSVVVAAVSVPVRALRASTVLVRRRDDTGSAALRAAATSALLVLVFGALFVSADRTFGRLAGEVLPDWSPGLLPFQLVVGLLTTALVCGGLLAHLAPVAVPRPSPARRSARVEWVLPLVALDTLFAAFVGVQFAVLFRRPGDATYAEYAREGFFQLLAVIALTLGVVAAAVTVVPHERREERRLLRVLLGLLCALTAVVLASAVRRLGLYEEAYGLSRARVVAHAVALWLGAVLALVAVAGMLWRGAWLPRAVVTTAAVALLALNLANPDALVAHSQVDRALRTGELDVTYVTSLSADAVPELVRLPQRACVLAAYEAVAESESWPGANLARRRAAPLVRRHADPSAVCATY